MQPSVHGTATASRARRHSTEGRCTVASFFFLGRVLQLLSAVLYSMLVVVRQREHRVV